MMCSFENEGFQESVLCMFLFYRISEKRRKEKMKEKKKKKIQTFFFFLNKYFGVLFLNFIFYFIYLVLNDYLQDKK